ncbi:MAG TPA: alpha-L-arabinofuranosidase, partial [Puia sp.]
MKTGMGYKARVAIVFLLVLIAACKKTSNPTDTGGNGNNTNNNPADSVYNPVDPSLPVTIGFFNDGWAEKSFVSPLTIAGTVPTSAVTDSLFIDLNKVLVKVPPSVYGNNSNLWMGQIVTQPGLVQYVKDLSPHIIRAPAGSVSDVYFWNGTDANPAPPDAPAKLMDASGNLSVANYWYGGNSASWTFSLSNYYALLAQTNSTGLITVNYGYARYGTSANPVAAAAHLAAEWVRYDKGRTKYWEIGNETYGNWEAGYQIDITQNKDGQPALVSGDLYGRHVKVFIDSM